MAVDPKELARYAELLNAVPAKSKKGVELTDNAKTLVTFMFNNLKSVTAADYQNHLDGKAMIPDDKRLKSSWLSRRMQIVTDKDASKVAGHDVTFLPQVRKTGKDADGKPTETVNWYFYLEGIRTFIASLPGAKELKENGVFVRVA